MKALLTELSAVDGTHLPKFDPALEIARAMARQGFIRVTDEAEPKLVRPRYTHSGRSHLYD
jgi:hypothetical protein